EGEDGEDLEERQSRDARLDRLRVDAGDDGGNVEPQLDERLLGDGLTVDLDALSHGGEVRRGGQARAQAMLANERLDHASGRGLAVGPGHVNHAIRVLRVT